MSIEIRKKEKELLQKEHAAYVSTSQLFNFIYDDDDNEESSIPLSDVISELPSCVAITTRFKSTEDAITPKSEGIFDNMCDVPFCDKNHFDAESDLMESLLNRDASIIYSPKIDSLLEEFAGELTPIHPIPPGIHPEKDIRLIEQLLYDDTSSDDDSYEDIDYVDASPPYYELVSLEEVKDFHSEDGEIEDDILCEKLSKINLRIAKIEALNANPTPSSIFVLKSPIPVEDGYSFLEKFETTPELETFKFDIEEKNSGSTTIHADISLPDLESARLGCAETKVATWDDLAFKLIILGWNVKDIHEKDKNEVNRNNTKHENEKSAKSHVNQSKPKTAN
ncbi:hypothetical protein Tco_0634831 [Tanacetum coccineum]